MYYFIVNLTSRTGRTKKSWALIEQELKKRQVSYKAYLSNYAGHVTELARMICNKQEEDICLVVVGGDGTVNEVINGMEHFEKVRFGYIPTGSGNDFGRGLGIATKQPLEALNRILNAKEEFAIDIGRVVWNHGEDGRYFAISSGIGFDAEVCEMALHSKIKNVLNKIGLGKLVYLVLTIKSLMHMEDVDATICYDETEVCKLERMIFTAAMNQPYEGGGVPMAPDATCLDGELSVISVEHIPKIKRWTMLIRLLNKKHNRINGCHLKNCKSLTLRTEQPMVVHADGEYCGRQNEIKYYIEPKKLRMLYK